MEGLIADHQSPALRPSVCSLQFTWTVQFAIAYSAPFASLGVDETGSELMQSASNC